MIQQADTQHITRSRISIPRRRADLLTRQRLLDSMDELLDKKIILINAPAGYGKTSLLIDLADDLALPICWYALDTLDQNLPRFLEYLVAAIQVRFPDFNTSLINVLRSSTQKEISIDTAVSILSNDIYDQITEHFIIMLDDYHLIKYDLQVNQFLSQFAQQTEENCHIIFASRSLLNLPDLPLLVARGLVGGLDQLDLAFNSHETRDLFFFQHHIVLSDDEAEVLQKQTEGWVTGLLLTARTAITRLIPKQKELHATGVNINDYFDLIYNAQSETVQQFLLYTSLLEDFNASLFANTIGVQFPHLQEQYQTCVDHILTSNLFVQSIQMDELSLRYHHLFLDYLQNKFKLEENVLYLELQVLIAGYYEETQQWEQAYQIYEQEGMLNRQVEFLEEYGSVMMSSGKFGILNTWIKDLLDLKITLNPALCSLYGAILSMLGDTTNSLEYLSIALSGLDTNENADLAARTYARKGSALRLVGRFLEAIESAKIALEIASNNLSLRSIRAEAYKIIGAAHFEIGDFANSLKYLLLSIEDFTFLNRTNDIAIVSLDIGASYFSLGQYNEAKQYFESDVSYWKKTGNYAWLANVLNNIAIIQQIEGDFRNSISNFHNALQYAKQTKYLRMEAIILCGIGDLYVDLEVYDEALTIYQQSLSIAREINAKHIIIYAQIGLASIQIVKENFQFAHEYLCKAKKIIEEIQSPFEDNLFNLYKGILKFKLGNPSKSREFISTAQDYFLTNKNNLYIGRCLLYTAIINFASGETDKTENVLRIINEYFASPENLMSLSPFGIREISNITRIFEAYSQYQNLHLFLNQMNSFNEQIPIIRKKVVQKKSIIPFIPTLLQITTLGSMKVKYNNKTLSTSDWQTQSARDFFFLMLSNPAGFTKEEIGLLLWPDDTLQEFRYHFRNAIYRVRHAIGKESILLEGDIYRFNSDQDFMLDAHEFEQDVQAFLLAESAQEKQKHYKRASKRYKGHYLPGLDLEIIRLERERLQALYRQMTLGMCQFTFRQEDFDQTVELANQALQQDPCNEEICRLAMKAESARGNRAEIARVFERCENALQNEYEAQPTEQTRKLYHILMRI